MRIISTEQLLRDVKIKEKSTVAQTFYLRK